MVKDYVMLNTFLFGITNGFAPDVRAISETDPIRAYRNDLFDHVLATNPIQAVLAFGEGAQHARDHWPGAAAFTPFDLRHPTAQIGVTSDWNQVLPNLRPEVVPDAGVAPDPTPYKPSDAKPIPEMDLPFGLPSWHGSGGTRSKRSGPNRIIWNATA